MEKKQEIDNGTINSESQNKPQKKYPDVPPHLNEAEKQKIEKERKGSSASLYTLADRELEYIQRTCRQLEVYDNLVIKKLWLACEKLQVIRNAITEGSVSTPVPEHHDEAGDAIEKEPRQLKTVPEHDDEAGDDIEKELRHFKKYIRKMKLPIPSKFDAQDLEKQLTELDRSAMKSAEQIAALVLLNQVPRLHKNPTFENSPAFKDFEVQYNELPANLKLCLLCFSAFPAQAIIKKRLMIYWWIAEGFIEPERPESDKESTKDLEQLGAEYFDKLIKKDFIKPYHYKRRLEVETCKMPPLIRSAVISIAARAKFFDFHSTGKPAADCPSSYRSALVGDKHGLESNFEFEKFHAVFNVGEIVLDIKPEWIQRMKNVAVLYLGRWQSMGNHHIEVDDEKFLESLGIMKHLKLLSLQGISRIVALPDQVSKLENLTILDLRACHNLEKIPNDIGLLKNLTHLDLSECYLLERIPKGLSKLRNLLVLKGFAVVKPSSKHSCSLEDLSKLPKLRKLSIFTGLKEFPLKDDLIAFEQFKKLAKLKIVWGGGEKKENGEPQNQTAENHQETSRPALENGDDRGSTKEPEALEVNSTKAPQNKTSDNQDMAKLPKLRDLKQNFCFGDTTPLKPDTEIAANDAMSSAEPVTSPPAESERGLTVPEPAAEPKNVQGPASGPEVTSPPESERGLTVPEPGGEGPHSSMSKTSSSSKSPAPEGSSKQLKRKGWNWKRIWHKSTSDGNDDAGSHLPATLEKLELQCFPNNKAPHWLNPTKLENLEKLYIRGGQLCELGGNTGGWNKPVDPWRKVKTLRLKYLTGLAMHWKEVDKLFPDLVFLEKVNCPMLTFFPCDEAGVWINEEKLSKQ